MKKTTNSGLFLLTVVVILSLVVFSGGVAGYSISPSGSQDIIDVSDRQVDSEYGSATISSVSSISGDDSVAVEVGVDAEETNPNLQVRDQDNSILRLRRNVEDGSIQSFDSSVFIPSGQSETTAGTYLISLWYEGEVVAAHPVVVQGYEISASVPESVEQGDTTTITADLSKRDLPANSELASVEMVVGNENAEIEKEMTRIDPGEYSVTIDTSELDSNSYRVYVAVRGDAETELGEKELLAISEVSDLSVENAEESDESDNNDSSENDSDEESDDTNDSGSNNNSSKDNTTHEPGSQNGSLANNSTNTSSSEDGFSESDGNTSSESSLSDDDQNTQTDSGTIEPTDNENSDSNDSSGTTSQDSTPGFGLTVVTIALIVVSLANRAR